MATCLPCRKLNNGAKEKKRKKNASANQEMDEQSS
jgi:hypothetical protein